MTAHHALAGSAYKTKLPTAAVMFAETTSTLLAAIPCAHRCVRAKKKKKKKAKEGKKDSERKHEKLAATACFTVTFALSCVAHANRWFAVPAHHASAASVCKIRRPSAAATPAGTRLILLVTIPYAPRYARINERTKETTDEGRD